MKKAEMLLKNSINSQLCCHCGVCAGMCPPQAITIKNNIVSINMEKCFNCGLCMECCPASGYELSDLTLEDIKDIPKYSIASKNQTVSKDASSGGFVTQTLLTLLSSREVTAVAVVVTGDNLDESCAKYVLTDDPNVIMRARQSKYTQATIDGMIEYIKNNNGRYAIVGLPCQLYGISQAMKKNALLRERIAYKIGMVCGYTYDEDCINGLLKVMDIKRETVIKILGWREGGLPGNFSVELIDGTVCSLPFADEHSVDVTYYAQNRCRLCRDCLCENGDVVAADIGGWKEKRTLVFIRSVAGQKLLDKLINSNSLIIEKCNIPFEKTVIPFMLREKRAKVDLRLRNKTEKPFWVGGYSPKLLFSQKIEAVISAQYEKEAIENKLNHSAKKMLKLGHKAYHEISSLFILKVLFKLQVYGEKIIKICQSKLDLISHVIGYKFAHIDTLRSKKMVKVVIIGLGKWGAQYLGFLSRSRHFKLVAAYDFDTKKLHSLCNKYGIVPASSIGELCKNYDAEAIFILTPTPTHYDVFCSVSEYGLPIYIEKPISVDMLSAQAMSDISKKANNILYIAHSMKYEPAIQEIKYLVENNIFGKINSFEITRSVRRKNNEYYENSALYQIGVHIIDVILFLFGKIDSIISRNKITREDRNYEHLSIRTCCNTVGKLNYGFSDVYNFTIKIIGEKITLIYADSKLILFENTENVLKKIPMINEKTIFLQLNEFYLAIREQRKYLNTVENAMEIMKLCDEIIKTGE